MRRGEIRWAALPGIGRRPVLILTRETALPVLHGILAAPLTRTVRGVASELPLGASDGLTGECVASFDNVTVVAKAAIGELIATLGPVRMAEACRALRFATGC